MIRILTAASIAVAGYLFWVVISGGAAAGCGPESSCATVLHSRWSRWFGLPVSALALPIYVIVLLQSFRLGKKSAPVQQRKSWQLLIPCAIAIIGAAIWFAIVQGFILKQFCPFCMVAHGCGLLAATLLLCFAPFREAPEKPWQQEKEVFVAPQLVRKLAGLSLLGMGLLVFGQAIHWPHRQYVVKMFDGKLEMDLADVPVIGRPEAPHSIISLFDYTCAPCRTMHGHLLEAQRRFSNQLAIINLPMPLCEKCNHTVKQSPPEHAQACDYARLGLAVWKANRKLHPKFEEWIFAPAALPSLADSKRYAAQLAGADALQTALKDPWIDQQIQRDISIYETNSLRGAPNMPQLIIGTNITSGTFGQANELFRLLIDNLGLK